MYEIVKSAIGTQWNVIDTYGYLVKTFDDKVKAQGYIDDMMRGNNDRLLTVQEERLQVAERSNGMDERAKEGLWGNEETKD